MTTTTTTTTTTTCETCRIDAKRQTGQTITRNEANHSMLWGCTCTPADCDSALSFVGSVTR